MQILTVAILLTGLLVMFKVFLKTLFSYDDRHTIHTLGLMKKKRKTRGADSCKELRQDRDRDKKS